MSRTACRDCRTCQTTDASKIAYGLVIAPYMFLLHVATMGATYLFVRRCPICRHRRSRHLVDGATAVVALRAQAQSR